MKYLLLSVLTISTTLSAQVPGAGTSGTGTVPGGTGMQVEGDTHVSPGGLGNNPAMLDRPRTNTGTEPMGPDTIGHPTNRSSGMTRSRQDMSGENMSSATHQSSNRNPKTGQADETFGVEGKILPGEDQKSAGPMKIDEAYPVGPYGRDEAQAEEEPKN